MSGVCDRSCCCSSCSSSNCYGGGGVCVCIFNVLIYKKKYTPIFIDLQTRQLP